MFEGAVEYLCACERKWNFSAKRMATDSLVRCDCGRAIVIKDGYVYSRPGVSKVDANGAVVDCPANPWRTLSTSSGEQYITGWKTFLRTHRFLIVSSQRS